MQRSFIVIYVDVLKKIILQVQTMNNKKYKIDFRKGRLNNMARAIFAIVPVSKLIQMQYFNEKKGILQMYI